MVSGRSEAILVVTAVFLGLSQFTVLLRFYVRLRIVRSFGTDDWIMFIAMVSLRPQIILDLMPLISRRFSILASDSVESSELCTAWVRRMSISMTVQITMEEQCW